MTLEFPLSGELTASPPLAAFQCGVLDTLEQLGYVWDSDETSPEVDDIVIFKVYGVEHSDNFIPG